MPPAPPTSRPSQARRGSASPAWAAFLGSVVLLAVMIVLLARDAGRPAPAGPDALAVRPPPAGATSPASSPAPPDATARVVRSSASPRPPRAGDGPLAVYCAAGIRLPVDATAREYQSAFGVQVNLQYGGSQTLLANLQISEDGDLYIPADESYVELARKKDLIAEVIPLARMSPVLAVARGNPQNLRTLDDLLKQGVTLAQAKPDAAAIGKVTRDALGKLGQWDALAARTTTYTGTVNQAADAVKLGSVHAAIIWDALGQQYPDLELIRLPQFEGVSSSVGVAVLKSSKRPTAALQFARYLAARDKGLVQFKKFGFVPADGDPWSAVPEIHLLGGAMLRPAIEKTLADFERREGARIDRVYNGCGILVAQMRAGERPDAYFACDPSFMAQVRDLFLPPADVSQNQLVIVVPKDNPYQIHSLKDLARPGVRIGVGHEKQCALGALTQKTLTDGGVYAAVMKNVATKSPTGDFLVNQLRAGGLDAVVAYVSNTAGAGGELLALPIDLPCATATQPIAVGRASDNKQLTARLVDAIKARPSREQFLAEGFGWKGGE